MELARITRSAGAASPRGHRLKQDNDQYQANPDAGVERAVARESHRRQRSNIAAAEASLTRLEKLELIAW